MMCTRGLSSTRAPPPPPMPRMEDGEKGASLTCCAPGTSRAHSIALLSYLRGGSSPISPI